MSHNLQSIVNKINNEIFSSSQKSILKAYLGYCDWETGENCYPSVKRISEDTGFSTRTVIKALKYFRAIGLFIRTRLHRARIGLTAAYKINLELLNNFSQKVKNACGIPVNKPLLGEASSPVIGEASSHNLLDTPISTNTVGDDPDVDNPPDRKSLLKAAKSFLELHISTGGHVSPAIKNRYFVEKGAEKLLSTPKEQYFA